MVLLKIVKAFIPPLIVFAIHVPFYFLGVYNKIEMADIPMHFVGGAAVGFSFSLMLKIAEARKFLREIHNALSFLFVLSLVALTAVIWEFAEYIVSMMTGLILQNGFDDTMADLLFGLIGAPFGYLIAQNGLNKQ